MRNTGEGKARPSQGLPAIIGENFQDAARMCSHAGLPAAVVSVNGDDPRKSGIVGQDIDNAKIGLVVDNLGKVVGAERMTRRPKTKIPLIPQAGPRDEKAPAAPQG